MQGSRQQGATAVGGSEELGPAWAEAGCGHAMFGWERNTQPESGVWEDTGGWRKRKNGCRRRATGVVSVGTRLAGVVALCAMATWSVRAQGEVSPCQSLVDVGASAPEVRECYLVQTQQQPSNPAAWMALGTDFHTEGETLDAATAYKNVIRIAPESDLAARAHLHIGVIFHSQGELDEALDAYRQSVALRPNPDTLLNMAIILYERGDHTEAVESCRHAVAANPEYFAAYAQMAIMQQSSGDILQAIATYQQAIALKPDYGPAYFNLGTAYEHAGDLPKAIEQYQTAITLEPSPEAANPKFHRYAFRVGCTEEFSSARSTYRDPPVTNSFDQTHSAGWHRRLWKQGSWNATSRNIMIFPAIVGRWDLAAVTNSIV
jgi:tetratricopeptide (TPR) repeat protein